jgi:sirohydrochlorin cobaltochelatase
MNPNTALVLFSHGSLLCGSGETLGLHANRLRKSGKYLAVEPGYLNYTSPPIEDAVRRCAEAGADTVVVVPYFLVAGKFVRVDLPLRMESVARQHPGIRFVMGRALEDCREMGLAVGQVTLTAQDPKQWQVRAIEKARRQCELRSDCPLYGTAMCLTGMADV